MIPIPTLIQSPGGCPQGCGAGASFMCVSRAGSGNLRGWSKFQNFNSGDWNLRKFTRRDTSGTSWQCIYTEGTCATLSGASSGEGRDFDAFYCLWDVASNSAASFSGSVYFGKSQHDPAGNGPTCDWPGRASETGSLGYCTAMPWPVFPSSCQYTETATDFSITRTGNGVCCFATAWRRGLGSQTYSLGIPDTVTAALARGTSTAGTLCKTTAGTIGSTGAGSSTQLAISGATAVTVTISMTGLTASQAYTLTASINRHAAGGGAFVDTIQVEIDFVADAASDSIDYEVPLNTDFDYEFASIVSVLAA